MWPTTWQRAATTPNSKLCVSVSVRWPWRVRYQVGAEALQSWLAAQETRRNAEVSLAQNRLNQLLNYIDLCQALGGPAQPQQAGEG